MSTSRDEALANAPVLVSGRRTGAAPGGVAEFEATRVVGCSPPAAYDPAVPPADEDEAAARTWLTTHCAR